MKSCSIGGPASATSPSLRAAPSSGSSYSHSFVTRPYSTPKLYSALRDSTRCGCALNACPMTPSLVSPIVDRSRGSISVGRDDSTSANTRPCHAITLVFAVFLIRPRSMLRTRRCHGAAKP